jgi:hypothetical protein
LKINNKDKLCIITLIANVALLIRGTIIHSLLGLSIDKNIIIINPKQYQVVGSTFNL